VFVVCCCPITGHWDVEFVHHVALCCLCCSLLEYMHLSLYVLCTFVCHQGREEGAEIDEWEDPEFEVYHITDRYGFIQ